MVVLPLAVVLVASLLGNALFAVRFRDEQDRRRAAETSAAAMERELERLRAELNAGEGDDPLERVASAVARIRGLSFRRAVEPELLSPAQLRKRIRGLILRDSSRAEIEADGRVLQALGLLAADVDFYELFVSIYQSQVIGFYDSKSRSLAVSSTSAENLSSFDRVTLAHEYTHALTDQHFGLKRLDALDEKGRDDEATAFLALIEGDAQLMSGLYYSQALTPEEQRAFSGGAEAPPEMPRFLREVLLFPYTEGLEFVRALYNRGGFSEVDRAYRDPPASTEQILHPSRYMDTRDDPVAVALPDVARALGSGWTKLADGGVGELDVRVMVDEFLSSPDARAAGGGWDGGRYVAIESRQGVLVAMLTAWDSVAEAREAATMLGRWLPLRYGNVGSDFDPGGNGRGWTSPKGAGLALRNEREVLLLLGPTEASVQRARGAFSGF